MRSLLKLKITSSCIRMVLMDTKFKSSSEEIEIVDETTEYWKLENFMLII